MANKEERIRVLVSKNPCEKCDIKPCTRKCMFRTLFEKAPGMTRQEAIKRIAKAFCQYTFNRTCEDCPLDDLACEDVLEHYGLIGGSTEAYNALLKK